MKNEQQVQIEGKEKSVLCCWFVASKSILWRSSFVVALFVKEASENSGRTRKNESEREWLRRSHTTVQAK
jgi:hypothetical protein